MWPKFQGNTFTHVRPTLEKTLNSDWTSCQHTEFRMQYFFSQSVSREQCGNSVAYVAQHHVLATWRSAQICKLWGDGQQVKLQRSVSSVTQQALVYTPWKHRWVSGNHRHYRTVFIMADLWLEQMAGGRIDVKKCYVLWTCPFAYFIWLRAVKQCNVRSLCIQKQILAPLEKDGLMSSTLRQAEHRLSDVLKHNEKLREAAEITHIRNQDSEMWGI